MCKPTTLVQILKVTRSTEEALSMPERSQEGISEEVISELVGEVWSSPDNAGWRWRIPSKGDRRGAATDITGIEMILFTVFSGLEFDGYLQMETPEILPHLGSGL